MGLLHSPLKNYWGMVSMTKPISIYKMKGKVKKINLKPPPRKWLAVLPRRKIQGDKKSKAVRPNQMEKTPYGRISPPGEEKNQKFQKILKNFKNFQVIQPTMPKGVF